MAAHSRRVFLLGTATLALSLSGCAWFPARGATSPQDLAAFLELSGVLAGVEPAQLDASAGRAIMQALSGFPSCSVKDLLIRCGYAGPQPARSLAELEARGIFADPQSRQLVDAILQTWYSGVAPGPQGPVPVTYAGALQWRALGLTAPPGTCHGRWW